jgi:NAD(P)-dependent dehydrogenase (short-subunit alcohol dehydrogenase family)
MSGPSLPSTFSTKGKVALVTGASSGIGRAASISLYRAGWTVILTARRRDALEESISLLNDGGEVVKGRAGLIVADLAVIGDIIKLFEQVKKDYGRLDLLFNVGFLIRY